jgi:hypothetical protein
MIVTISPATDEEVQSGEIGRRLRQFNYTLSASTRRRSTSGSTREMLTGRWLNDALTG